jgi:hypothetical protein
MNISLRRIALIFVGGSLALIGSLVPATRAADHPVGQTLADKAPSLPVSTSFDKVTSGDDSGLYVLSIKNTSSDSLKVSATIVSSVTFHGNSKTQTITDHPIDAGQTWTIAKLAAGDKVTLTAAGFDPLELTAP